jgi:hypothetical protein
MEPKRHECSAEMRGDRRRVLDALVIALSSSGFRVDRRSANDVELAGPARFGSQRNPIVGASRIVARASDRRLVVEAELGGVERMHRFLFLLPLQMSVVFGIVFGGVVPLVFRERFAQRGWILLAPMLGMVVVLFLIALVVGPFATRKFESMTKEALDALATSVATIGADG